MNKFASWLDSNPNMATKLAQAIGVKRASMSKCKTGKMLMPNRWMDLVVEMSGGQLDHKTLVNEREFNRKARMSNQ